MSRKPVAVFDVETDPFQYGRVPQVFAVGFYNGEEYASFWGDNAIDLFLDYIADLPPHIIYAHNGGKFDFHYLLMNGVIGNPLLINNGRIMKATCLQHELRDSYSAIPVPLAMYQKDSIEYWKFEREVREKYKTEILDYLKTDCVSLHNLISAFIDRFGLKLTIGSAALSRLKEFHPFGKLNRFKDEMIRPYYHGGRVQPFEAGTVAGDWKVYDVNSMYPYVMAEKRHPIGDTIMELKPTPERMRRLLDKNMPFFATITADSNGALPVKTDKGLFFPKGLVTSSTTSHEIAVGMEYGLLKIREIHQLLVSNESGSFSDYVNLHINEKINAKKSGDKASEIFAKLLLNSAYGKCGQSPDNFKDWHIEIYGEGERPEGDEWLPFEETPLYRIWQRPAPKPVFHNVGIAASVTGAARAVLLEGIIKAERPAYCDTDSLICEGLNMPLDPYRLGAWDTEAQGDTLSIGGKKLYALFANGKCVKRASKGVRFDGDQIRRICEGEILRWHNNAPSYSVTAPPKFVARKVAKTIEI